MKKWLANKKIELALKWLKGTVLTPVRIVRKAGTDYIVSKDGAYHKIGRSSKCSAN